MIECLKLCLKPKIIVFNSLNFEYLRYKILLKSKLTNNINQSMCSLFPIFSILKNILNKTKAIVILVVYHIGKICVSTHPPIMIIKNDCYF